MNISVPVGQDERVAGTRDQVSPRRTIDGRLVYAVGDIHGCYEELRSLLAILARDSTESAGNRRPTLVFCGDYVDRGPASADVLEALCWLDKSGPFDLRCIKGNHDAAFLSYIEDPDGAGDWLRHGGRSTLRSYGVEPADERVSSSAHRRVRDDLLAVMPASHLRLLQTLKPFVKIGDYAFVHAGIRPGIPLDEQFEEDLLWIRREFIDFRGAHEHIVVHGHTWKSDRIDVQGDRIGIDTGAYETGVLTALRIEDSGYSVLRSSTGQAANVRRHAKERKSADRGLRSGRS